MSISVSGLGPVQTLYPVAIAPIEAVPPVAPVADTGSSAHDYSSDAAPWSQGATYLPAKHDDAEALTYPPAAPPVSELSQSALVIATGHVGEADVHIAPASAAVAAPSLSPGHAVPQSPGLPGLPSAPADAGDHDSRAAEAVASAAYALVADATASDQPSELDFPKYG